MTMTDSPAFNTEVFDFALYLKRTLEADSYGGWAVTFGDMLGDLCHRMSVEAVEYFGPSENYIEMEERLGEREEEVESLKARIEELEALVAVQRLRPL